ncbi:BCAS1 protein, partial [Copsychus sechellarum]|nr:BCAS1 protein [Copsychus sechellarum]
AGAAGLSTAPRRGAAAQQRGHNSAAQASLAGTPEGHDVAAPKARPVTLLDRIFRLEKGPGSTRGDAQQGRPGSAGPDGSIAAGAPNAEIDECTQKELGQDSAGEQGPAAAAPGRAQLEQESAQAASGQGSVMSFLKTLVRMFRDAQGCSGMLRDARGSGMRGWHFSPHLPAHSPSCISLSRLLPERPQGSGGPFPAQRARGAPGVVTPRIFLSPSRIPRWDALEEPLPKPASSSISRRPRRSLSVSCPALPPGSCVFRGTAFSGSFRWTLNAPEKPLAPSDSDPGGQRSREGSKEKKSTLELGKQKGREQPEPREGAAAEPDSVQNGGDAKDPPYKKTEKRQSLGGFFKGL